MTRYITYYETGQTESDTAYDTDGTITSQIFYDENGNAIQNPDSSGEGDSSDEGGSDEGDSSAAQ